MFSELAKRVGLGDYFTMGIPEYIDIRLQTQYPLIAGIQPPVTYERLKAEKMIRAAAPPEPKYTPYLNPAEVLDNETGRMEIIYSEKLADLGMATTRCSSRTRSASRASIHISSSPVASVSSCNQASPTIPSP